MMNREAALKTIVVGDIFHATSPNDASLVCLALKVTPAAIHARTVTSQYEFEFDRTAGTADWEYRGRRVQCFIDSVATLPDDVHQTMLGLDRKYSTSAADSAGPLTEDERRALVFVARYFPQNPLTPPQAQEVMSVGRQVGEPVDIDDYDGLSGDEKVALILVNFLIPDNRSEK